MTFDLEKIEPLKVVRDVSLLTVSSVFLYIFVYLAISGQSFEFKPGSLTIFSGLALGILGVSFASRMYMREVACQHC